MRILSRILSSLIVVTIATSAHSQGIELNADRRAKGLDTTPAGPVTDSFQTTAKQAILVDFDSDTVLYSRDGETRMFPSSMTKVLTMYIVFDQLKKGNITLDSEMAVSERAWRTGGSKMFIKVGDHVKVNDLINGVIVQSGNDACVALAEGISGSVEAFVEDMNSVAKQLGMEHTHFANPDGLPADGHYSTARDLSILARKLIEDFPEYFKYYSTREFTYGGIKQHNRNRLLDVPDLGVDGLKTGYTEMGGYGMIATGTNKGRRLVAVVNGLESENKRLEAAAELLRYGYNNFIKASLFKKGDELGRIAVWGGEKNRVSVAPDKDITLLLHRASQKESDLKVEAVYKEPWIAPIAKGAHMASLVVKDANGRILTQAPLYATADVEEAGFFKKLMQKAKLLPKKLW